MRILRARWARGGVGTTVVLAAALGCGQPKHYEVAPSGGAGTGGASQAGFTRATSGASDGSAPMGPDGGTARFGVDCPAATQSSLPARSPRVLILGPAANPNIGTLAGHLRGMLESDPAFELPTVLAESIDLPAEAGSTLGGRSLMYYFYAPEGRNARLAMLASPWTYVVLLEQADYAVDYPEFYFEGVRVLGCSARAVGAKPVVLMSWPIYAGEQNDVATRGAIAYRVANGTGSILAPAGYAWAAGRPDSGYYPVGGEVYLAAATLYSTLTGRDAARTSYVPAGMAPSVSAQLSGTALATVTAEAAKRHYFAGYSGVVAQEAMAKGGALRYMSYGTSSEALWQGDMATIVPLAGLTPQATQLAAPEGAPMCEADCLAAATPNLAAHPYDLMYARFYGVDAGAFLTIGAQPALQVQVWDRHADNIPADGLLAVGMMENVLLSTYTEAKNLGLVLTPYHLMFAKLKTMRPTAQLTRDGTHATPAVAYGQATMSVVARTGIHTPTVGLDAETAVAAELAEETIRQLATLSASGVFVGDDPNTRPAP